MAEDPVLRTMLFDFYGELLTDKQREYFDLHYNEDLSLAEIAALTGISRQGVWDIIKRAEATLKEIEAKTGRETRVAIPGHTQRGGQPDAQDRIFATQCGVEAALGCLRGEFGYMIALRDGKMCHMPLEDVAGKLKYVDPQSDLVRERWASASATNSLGRNCSYRRPQGLPPKSSSDMSGPRCALRAAGSFRPAERFGR